MVLGVGLYISNAIFRETPSTYSEKKSSEQSCPILEKGINKIRDVKNDFIIE